jgi:RNA polymerase sigma-70 factor (ECF subfamily)
MKVDTTHENPTDEEIALRVQQGDSEIFGVLVDRYEQKLLRYGRKFLSRPEDVQDIVQDVFIRAYRNIQSFDSTQRFNPWIYRIAHNAYLNTMRRNSLAPISVDFDTVLVHFKYDDPSESEREQKDMRDLIERSMNDIPAKYREVLILHYFEEMPYKDIADVLQIPVGTVSIRLRRAREALKKNINPAHL